LKNQHTFHTTLKDTFPKRTNTIPILRFIITKTYNKFTKTRLYLQYYLYIMIQRLIGFGPLLKKNKCQVVRFGTNAQFSDNGATTYILLSRPHTNTILPKIRLARFRHLGCELH